MTTTKTKITTDYSRELNVTHSTFDVNLHVKDTDGFYGERGEVYTSLRHGEAAQLAAALVGENATVITDLPEAKLTYGDVTAGGVYRSENADPAELLRHGKALLAMSAFLVKHNAEQEEAKKAEAEAAKAKEAANAKRRDAVVKELRGQDWGSYDGSSDVLRAAVDRIIDLEEAAKVS